jgi:hypothetical protein
MRKIKIIKLDTDNAEDIHKFVFGNQDCPKSNSQQQEINKDKINVTPEEKKARRPTSGIQKPVPSADNQNYTNNGKK